MPDPGRSAGATDGALALVSGRSLQQLDRLFSPLQLSAAGLHGLERRKPAGEVVRAEADPAILAAARRRLGAFAAEHAGVMLEDKGLTLALHTARRRSSRRRPARSCGRSWPRARAL